MKLLTVEAGQEGQRLDRYLARVLPAAPSSFLHKMLRKKNITLNGRKADGGERLQAGDEVRLFLSEETLRTMTGAQDGAEETKLPEGLDEAMRRIGPKMGRGAVLYEDDDILIAVKPFGVLSQKAAREDVSMNEWLLAYLLREQPTEAARQAFAKQLQYFRPSVCNRLDRNTGGILLCGKSLRGARCLTKMLRDRTLRKYYTAVLTGAFSGADEIRSSYEKDAAGNKAVVRTDGQEAAVTRYRTLRSGAGRTLAEAELVTGKSHQLRAHFAMIGHPILGDAKYGGRKAMQEARDRSVPAQYLFCSRVEFPKEGEDAALLPEALRGAVIGADVPAAFTEALRADASPARRRTDRMR